MESYDPRKPIIKATDDETDEVHGHSLIEAEQGETSDVEGHQRGQLQDADASDEIGIPATEDGDDDPEVEGHIRHFR